MRGYETNLAYLDEYHVTYTFPCTCTHMHTHTHTHTHTHAHTHTHTQESASKSGGGHEIVKLSRGENELRKCLGNDTKESLIKSELTKGPLTMLRAVLLTPVTVMPLGKLVASLKGGHYSSFTTRDTIFNHRGQTLGFITGWEARRGA